MTVLIALAVIGLLAAVTIAATIGTVSAAIRREEKHHTLTGEAPGPLAQAGRRLNGVYVRMPSPPPPAIGTRQLPSPLKGPADHGRTVARARRSRRASAFTPHRVMPPAAISDRLGAAGPAADCERATAQD